MAPQPVRGYSQMTAAGAPLACGMVPRPGAASETGLFGSEHGALL